MTAGGDNAAVQSAAGATPGRKPLANPITWVWSVGILLVGLVIGGGGWVMWQLYEAERREAIQSVTTLALAASEQLDIRLRTADAYLAGLAAISRFDDDGRLLNAEEIDRMIEIWRPRRSATSGIFIVDAHGDRLAGAQFLERGSLSFDAWRTGVRWLPANNTMDFDISAPLRDPGTGKWISLLRRPIHAPDGRLIAAIVNIVDIDGLEQSLAHFKLEAEGSISILIIEPESNFRTVLARVPHSDAQLGRRFQTTPGIRDRFSTDKVEVYFGSGVVDGIPRLLATRPIAGYRLAVAVGTVWRDIIDRWYKVAPEILSAIVGAIAFIGILMFALAWQIGRRLRGEQRLSAMLGELADRRRGELEAQQSKLDALARMSGGVAHEFSNLLQPITTLSELGRKAASRGVPAPAAQYFERIGTAARQAVSIAGDFLTFCGTSQRRGSVAEIRPALLAAVRQIQPLLPERCRLDVSASVGLRAYFDDVGLVQIVTNLVKNSIEAWQRSPVAPLSITVTALALPGGRGVELRFADNGPGMTDAVRARIFEPFFTTKGATGGTGLGLSVIYGVVTSWGGRIDVQSRPGHGTTTMIELRNSEEGDRNERPKAGPDAGSLAA